MENYLQRNLDLFAKKFSFLVVLLAMGTGMAFSQTLKTVTSDADEGAGSLRQAIADAVDGDTIKFTGIDTILVGLPLELGNKTLVIDGEGVISLDGRLLGTDADSNRVITVIGAVDKKVTLLNLTIQHGYAKDTAWDGPGLCAGGGMLVTNMVGGELMGDNLTFISNKSTARGGGLYAYGKVTIMNSTFKADSALDGNGLDGGYGDGGGAYADSLVTFMGCLFEDCYAGDAGGGLVIDTLTLVDDCEFNKNWADNDAGGLKMFDRTSMVTNSDFYLNGSADNGGAIQATRSTIEGCVFDSNYCDDDGGAIYIEFAGGLVKNCTFTRNFTTTDDGGAVSCKDAEGILVIGCEFDGNKALGDHSGALHMDGPGLIDDCILKNSWAEDDGGATELRNGATMQNSTLFGNYSNDNGGAIHMDETSSCINLNVYNNEAMDQGGGIFIKRGSVINSSITANFAGEEGGGISTERANVLIENCYIANNESLEEGGGLYLKGGIARNCVIDNNEITGSARDGGGVYMDDRADGAGDPFPGLAHGANLIGCVVTNNITTDEGGGVYVQQGNVINCNIVNNTAVKTGGVRGDGLWLVTNSIIYDNTSTGNTAHNVSIKKQTGVVSFNYTAADTAGCGILPADMTDCVILDASPFVGGAGADSLRLLSGSALIDAGTVSDPVVLHFNEDSVVIATIVEDLLPMYDIDGDLLRVAGSAIDFGVYEEYVAVTAIDIVEDTVLVGNGGTLALTLTLEPEQPSDAGVTWSSGDEAIATVEDGVVSGILAASATYVYVKSVDDPSLMDSCWVKVEAIPVDSVKLDMNTLDIVIGKTGKLVASVYPAIASDASVTWSSADGNIATVVDGVVTSVGIGMAYVYVKTNDGDLMDSCLVTVLPVEVTGVSLNKKTLTVKVGETGALVATVAPNNASDMSVTWSTANAAVATVDNGTVSGVAIGEAYIYVTATDGGFKDSCLVTVPVNVTGVSLDKHALALLLEGNPGTIAATVAPANATDLTVKWTTANAGVATVVNGTTVMAKGVGETYIYVTTTDGGFMDSCLVTVTSNVGISDAKAAGISMYPNPVDGGVLFIELATNSKVQRLEVYNTLGVLIIQENVDNRSLIEIHTNGLPEKGMYFVRFIQPNSNYVERFIVQ